ncbi:TPR repeat family protein [Synechococcus sp. WH 8103]|nr:TPR repeat family protein [Synechococcus sp. WH 8103]
MDKHNIASKLLAQATRLHTLGDTKEAKFIYLSLIRSENHSEIVYSNLGLIFQAEGDKERALKYFKRAIKINPNFADAHLNIGSLYSEMGRKDKAISCLQRSISLKPESDIAYLNLGCIYADQGDYARALSFTLKSYKINPNNPSTLTNLGNIYLTVGKANEAVIYFQESLKREPTNDAVLAKLGGIFIGQKQPKKAIKILRDSLNISPRNPIALANLGVSYKLLGKMELAVTLFVKSLELNPDNPVVNMNLGIVYELLYKLDLALSCYVKSAKLFSKERDGSSLTSLISSSIILIHLGKIDDAWINLRSAAVVAASAQPLKNYSKGNESNDNAYMKFLGALIPLIPRKNDYSCPKILHIGDSHCLSFSHQIVSLGNQNFEIKPCLVMGTKAYHLGNESPNNAFQLAFINRIKENFDRSRYLLLSFGEIDCREAEGIIPYCLKTGKNIQEVSTTTAERYVRWISRILKDFSGKVILLGVAAPSRVRSENHSSLKANSVRPAAISSFNSALRDTCISSKMIFLDVFELTADQDGFNNEKWMLDGVHLKPGAIHCLLSSYMVE